VKEQQTSRFIKYLYQLDPKEDREIFAVFRRGLGKPPGSVFEMYRYIFVPKVSSWMEKVCFMIASLYALYPVKGNESLGKAMAKVLLKRTNGKYQADSKNINSIERRFWRLLSCHPDDIFEQLTHTVSLIKSDDVPIDWDDLYRVLARWQYEESRNWEKKRWAKDFYLELTCSTQNDQGETDENNDEEVFVDED